jgi:CubicO group peptidase (beta-lactamase class C family)
MATTIPPQRITLRNLPKGLPRAQVLSHVIAPAHVKNVRTEVIDPAHEVNFPRPIVRKKFPKVPVLDLGAFGLEIYTILKDNVTGYALQVRQNGNPAHFGIWNWAQTPADNGTGWSEDTRMHLASVSKFLTGLGLVKLLKSKGISYDAKIVTYLPGYWDKGTNVDKITFRHLLTHTSGFSTGSSASDYTFMKSKVAAGVGGVGGYDYENMNFGLCRILIPIINGNISKTADFGPLPESLIDQVWDAVTLYHYRNYLQAKVFSPAGVSGAGFAPSPVKPNALAYPFPNNNKKGWNSGDLSSVAGGAAWHLSPNELLNVMGAARRKNTIVSKATAQYMLDNYFGIDQKIDTPAGTIYNKNGAWGTGDGRTEQCVAYFFPNGMEAVLLVNSPIGAANYSLRNIVKTAFLNSLKS